MMRRLNLLGVNAPLLMGTTFFSEYETPIWTLIGAFIGALIGFGLSAVWTYYHERREHKARIGECIERIKKSMRLISPQRAIQLIVDLLPQFKEEEQIKILSEVGLESSMKNDEVTKCVIEELKCICVLYEVELDNFSFTKKSLKDEKKVRLVLKAIWEISSNSIEYRQSKESVSDAFNLVQMLDLYSIKQGYVRVISASIRFYRQMGEYSVSMWDRTPNFEFGIAESINRLKLLKQKIPNLRLEKFTVTKFLEETKQTIDFMINKSKNRLKFLKQSISNLKSEKITVDMLLEEANQAIDFIVKERDSKLNN